MLGFGKMFIIFLFLSAAIAYGMRDPWVGVKIMGAFIVIRILWRFFT